MPLTPEAPGFLLSTGVFAIGLIHMLAMNAVLGGSFFAVLGVFMGKSGERLERLAGYIGKWLPGMLIATTVTGLLNAWILQIAHPVVSGITVGLLQVPMNVAFALIPVGLVCFVLFKRAATPSQGKLPLLIGFLAGAFGSIVSSSLSALALVPDNWEYIANGAIGWTSVDGLTWRYLHILFGAVGVAALMVALAGLKEKARDPEQGQWMVEFGARWFVAIAGIEIIVGMAFLGTLPKEVMLSFMKDPVGFLLLVLGLGLSVVSLMLFAIGRKRGFPQPMLLGGFGSAALLVAVMVLMRQHTQHPSLITLPQDFSKYPSQLLPSSVLWVTAILITAAYAGVAIAKKKK